MPADSSLADRVVVVTGGSRGIGREIALALVEAGARVAIVATAESPQLEETVKAVEASGGRGRVLSLIGDVRSVTDCERVAGDVLKAFGSIDVLFNNAALGMPTVFDGDTAPPPFWQIEPKRWSALVDTNINGVFLMTRAVMPAMLAQRFGKIVNLSTNARTMVRKQGSPYGPSKVFVEAASRAWAQDLQGTGVTVNVLVPGGAIDTSRTMVLAAPRGNAFIPISVMRPPALWLASDLSNAHSGDRFIARLWNEELPLAARIAAARDSGAELPKIM